MDKSTISVLVDNESWVLPYAEDLVLRLREKGYDVRLARQASEIRLGWINFMLGCIRLVPREILERNTHNLVVHESDLPTGRGFAPMAWQILEGRNCIPVCLLEAVEEADAGKIWLKDEILLEGNELCPEWRSFQGEKTVEMCLRFVTEYSDLIPQPQKGHPTAYKKRTPTDSELDVNKTIAEQFNLLRVVDNECYPAFFNLQGRRFKISVEPDEREP